jgi:hypothetical protein
MPLEMNHEEPDASGMVANPMRRVKKRDVAYLI